MAVRGRASRAADAPSAAASATSAPSDVRGNPAGYYQGWQRFTTTPGQASVCFTIFPPLDPATTTVDVSVLGRGLVQDVPVQDGALNKPGAITGTGHTDADGDPADNLDLSKRRAQTIAEALRAQLGAGYSFTVKGEGESKPVASNDTSAGRAQNRRVTIAFGA